MTAWRAYGTSLYYFGNLSVNLRAFPVAQMVKNPLAMQEIQVPCPGWEDPLEKGMATHLQFSCPENPKNRGAWQATVLRIAKGLT